MVATIVRLAMAVVLALVGAVAAVVFGLWVTVTTLRIVMGTPCAWVMGIGGCGGEFKAEDLYWVDDWASWLPGVLFICGVTLLAVALAWRARTRPE